MANDRRIVTVEYLESEGLNHKQDYFADVSADEASGNRELSLKDANNNVVGQIIAQKEGSVLFKDVATPAEATDGANKGYADNNFANALKGTASGVSVRLDDVSPIEHTLGIKLHGKNMFDEAVLLSKPHTEDDEAYVFPTGTVGAEILPNAVFEKNTQYTLQYTAKQAAPNGSTTLPYPRIEIWYTDGTKTLKQATTEYTVITLTSIAGKTISAIKYAYSNIGTWYIKKNSISLAKGTAALSPYTPFPDYTKIAFTRCGKNLFDKSTLTASSSVTKFTQTADGFTFKTAATHKTMMMSSNIYLSAGTYYCSGTVTCSDATYKGGWGVHDDEDKKFIINASSKGIINDKFTITESKTYSLNFYAPYDAPTGVTMTFSNVQLELGATATEYELYKTPTEFTPAADGTVTGVKSLYPTTTLITNTSGVIIDAEYNRDINKAFAEMQQAILSMGGNV